MRIASLGSGSRGNATLIAAGSTSVLIDCGFSAADTTQRAAALGFSLDELTAILVTHEHSDHSTGVAALSRRYGVPVYLTHGTWSSGRIEACAEVRTFNAGSEFALGDLSIRAVAVPHDAREPVQYVISGSSGCVGLLTDLGSITPHVHSAFRGVDCLLLEFNHDRRMLQEGPYPASLKRRVAGPFGHLSNEQAADFLGKFLSQAETSALRRVFVAHISEKNNHRDRVLDALKKRCPQVIPRLTWACQNEGFPWFDLEMYRLDAEPSPARISAQAV